jgi:predicted Na+-dependent transporter
LWPSRELAGRSDLILAALVFTVGLTIDPRRFRAAARARRLITAAVLLPLVVLLPLAIALAALYDGATHDGLIALGLASAEVADAGLVALAGGDAALALTVIALSLGVTAAAAPVVAPLLAVRAHSANPRLAAGGDRAATLVLALLVYAALGDLGDLSRLGGAATGSALFLAGSIALALLLRPLLGELQTGGFVFALRDFAVAAALAGQFDRAGAAATPAVYGVLMLVVAAAAAPLIRHATNPPAEVSSRSPTANR